MSLYANQFIFNKKLLFLAHFAWIHTFIVFSCLCLRVYFIGDMNPFRLVDSLNYIRTFPDYHLQSLNASQGKLVIHRSQGEEEEVRRGRITVKKVFPSLKRCHITNHMGHHYWICWIIFIFDAGVICLLWEEIWVISTAKGYDLDLASLLLLMMAFLHFNFLGSAWNSTCSELV